MTERGIPTPLKERGRPSMVHRPGCPDPSKARYLCKCGANCACPSCGWGNGAFPCACKPLPKVGNVV